jgi:hypothetical protein
LNFSNLVNTIQRYLTKFSFPEIAQEVGTGSASALKAQPVLNLDQKGMSVVGWLLAI